MQCIDKNHKTLVNWLRLAIQQSEISNYVTNHARCVFVVINSVNFAVAIHCL